MTNKEIGFKTHTWKCVPIIKPTLIGRDAIEAQRIFLLSEEPKFKPPPPPRKWTLKDYWKEFKDRIYLAVQCLRHGRNYLD